MLSIRTFQPEYRAKSRIERALSAVTATMLNGADDKLP